MQSYAHVALLQQEKYPNLYFNGCSIVGQELDYLFVLSIFYLQSIRGVIVSLLLAIYIVYIISSIIIYSNIHLNFCILRIALGQFYSDLLIATWK